MIADAADAVIALSADLRNAQRSQHHGDALTKRNEILRGLLTRASAARETITALSERLGGPPTPVNSMSTALDEVRRWRARLDSDVTEALDGDAFPKMRAAVEKAVGQGETRARDAWRTYLTRTSPDVDTDLLDVLRVDPAAATTVERVETLSRIVDGFAAIPLPTADEVAQYDAMVADLRAAWSTLDLSSLDDEVVDFLREANGERGAALSGLTPAVLAWLTDRGLVTNYVVRPSVRR